MSLLADFPVLVPVTDEDLTIAALAVLVHVPESWPQGLLCRSERVPYPCRLTRWGHATIAAAGLSSDDVGALVGVPGVRQRRGRPNEMGE
ncbi:hypothetical protein FXF53_00595 [Micromonospora sp. WP24]|uniref:hypothetical protein n=1 Tax=Micromonospora sp. WP24 TaxID=2604469 RepID=UPI0011D86C5B|nr:hypothetical protein [Micromonospora sp. WP24]TYC07140.1 hypothetical protein FXF53_00595 [Micromonospora sp. WP24]